MWFAQGLIVVQSYYFPCDDYAQSGPFPVLLSDYDGPSAYHYGTGYGSGR